MNRKKAYKHLDKWRETNHKHRLKYYRKTQNVENKGKRWEEKDIKLVLDHEIPDTELSKKIGRSVQAIQQCRLKHK